MINPQTFIFNKKATENGIPVYNQVLSEETLNPMKYQQEILLKILNDNKDTEYGRQYGFADIKTIEDYQQRVPVITYDAIQEAILRMSKGEKNVLTAYSFSHMTNTSGTVGMMKWVPLTQEQTQVFVKYNRLFTDGLMGSKMSETWMHGRAFCTSEGTHETLESGITVGSASSVMVKYIGGADKADKFMRTTYTSPLEATTPKEGTDSKYIHARFWLEDEDCTGIVCGFFSLVSFYLKYIADNYELLINDIENGTIDSSITMPDDVKASLSTKIFPNPARAARLREIFANGSNIPFPPLVWPSLKYISGVGADGFSCFDKTISERFGGENLVRIYSGVTASEGLFSIPYELNNPDTIVAPGSGFIEFLPVEAGDDFSQIVTMDQLEVGRTYEIIFTNFCGFYRYRMSDAVQCTGYFNKTPLVQFMYRVNKTVNLVGEKVTEKALTSTIEVVMEASGISLREFTLYPNAEVSPMRYDFLLETESGEIPSVSTIELAHKINESLCRNNHIYEVEYSESHLLDECTVSWLEPGTNDKFIDLMTANGKTPSQQKPVRVISNDIQKSHFLKFRVNGSGMNKSKAIETIFGEQEAFIGISEYIWANPETGLNEQKAADCICDYLQRQGFVIDRGVASMPNAFTASFGHGQPRIGLLTEYDALDDFGHIHGHNLLSGGIVGAATAIKHYLEAYPDRGTVVLFGCPDQEHCTGKVKMAQAGLFNDIDIALYWHPSDVNMVPLFTTSALRDINYTFKGKSLNVDSEFVHRHNALEGAELMNIGVQYLRSQIAEYGRIDHSFVDAGNDTPSIVSDTTTIRYNIKTMKLKDMQWLSSRLDDIAQGAALMSDTSVTSRLVGACSGFIPNTEVCNMLYINFNKCADIDYSDEEMCRAHQLKTESGASSRKLKTLLSRIENPVLREIMLSDIDACSLFKGVIPPTSAELNSTAVTDVGDVSRICPVGLIDVVTWPVGLASTPERAREQAVSSVAHKGMLCAARVLTDCAIDFFENPARVQVAKNIHAVRTNGHPYESPLI